MRSFYFIGVAAFNASLLVEPISAAQISLYLTLVATNTPTRGMYWLVGQQLLCAETDKQARTLAKPQPKKAETTTRTKRL